MSKLIFVQTTRFKNVIVLTAKKDPHHFVWVFPFHFIACLSHFQAVPFNRRTKSVLRMDHRRYKIVDVVLSGQWRDEIDRILIAGVFVGDT